jgi:hypothetical protein
LGISFLDYKKAFDLSRASLKFPPGTIQRGIGCESTRRPRLPPWQVDWAILFDDGNHIRVRETWESMSHPNFDIGKRRHFGYQYGPASGTDEKAMPRTDENSDTILRVDNHPPYGPHVHYNGQNHVTQNNLEGFFQIADAEIFAFIDAVMTSRGSRCDLADYLDFKIKGTGRR